MKEACAEISDRMGIDAPTLLDHFLERNHSYVESPEGTNMKIVEYAMRSFWESCLALYPTAKLTYVATPYFAAYGGDENAFRKPRNPGHWT